MMKNIPYISVQSDAEIEAAFARLAPEAIACNNWAEEYPYAPSVSFRIFHSRDRMHLRFEVEEACTMARTEQDNGPVWTDSCVEFFFRFDEDGYYNLETSCIGRLLMAFRKSKPNPTYASEEVLALVRRRGTLGSEPFEERRGDNRWSMTLEIPAAALFHHKLERWDGLELAMNLYKCGDNLSQPHFLSWKPIDTPSPNFHQPQFFGPARCGEKAE